MVGQAELRRRRLRVDVTGNGVFTHRGAPDRGATISTLVSSGQGSSTSWVAMPTSARPNALN